MIVILLTILAIISTGLHLRAEYFGPVSQIYVFKPLTTSLIILLALTRPSPPSHFYKVAILVGLLFSLGGDIFLMLPSDRFLFGLVSFLLAHVAYTVAFSSVGGFYRNVWALLPFLLYGALVFLYLTNGASLKKAPGSLKLKFHDNNKLGEPDDYRRFYHRTVLLC